MESAVKPKKHRFFYLLLSLLLYFVLNAVFSHSEPAVIIFGVLFSIVLYFSVFTIENNKWLIVTTVVLAVLVFIGIWSATLHSFDKRLNLLISCAAALFFFLISSIVLYHTIRDKVITFNTICGAICGYLLMGFFWSFIYAILYFTNAHAFNLQQQLPHNIETELQLFSYYSFVSLTTLGYGDIVAVSNIAKTFSWMEAAAGQIYLTVWIAQLVGLHIAQKR